MQIPTFLPLVLWALNLAAANPLYPTDFCYADNCARAVTGTASVGALVGGGALRTVRAILDCSAALQPILTIMVNPPTPTAIVSSLVRVTSILTVTNLLTLPSLVLKTATTNLYIQPTIAAKLIDKRAETTTDSSGYVITRGGAQENHIQAEKRDNTYTDSSGYVTTKDDVSQLQRRASPTIPFYASPCLDLAQYTSACSCWSILPLPAVTSLITAAIPIATVTITSLYYVTIAVTTILPLTIFSPTTSTSLATAMVSSFNIRAKGGSIDGQLLQNHFPNIPDQNVPIFSPSSSSAVKCTQSSSDRTLQCNGGGLLATIITGCGQYFQILKGFTPSFYDLLKLKCDVDRSTGKIACDAQGFALKASTQWYSCPVKLGSDAAAVPYLMQGLNCVTAGCTAIELYAEPA